MSCNPFTTEFFENLNQPGLRVRDLGESDLYHREDEMVLGS